jgi:hypothetical protein
MTRSVVTMSAGDRTDVDCRETTRRQQNATDQHQADHRITARIAASRLALHLAR